MAKKSSASQTRKKTSRKKTTTRSRAGAAKKKSTTAKKSTSKKKVAAKKKSTTRKKTTSAKSTSKKKTTSKKSTTKKKAAAKSSARTTTKSKKTTSKKKSTAKKSSVSKAKTKSGKSSGAKGDSSSKGKANSQPKAQLGAAREAARRLAAAAGLTPLSQRSTTTEEKSTKTKRVRRSPLKPEQLEEFRLILLQKRSEVLGDVTEMENEALGGRSGALSSFPQHLADQGSDEYDQSLALGLAASQRKLLAEIDAALERIENGTYGICEVLGIPISRQRLEAQPWTRVSLDGARQQDSYTAR